MMLDKNVTDRNIKHTFVVCAYKKSEYLEQCVRSVVGQSVKTKVAICTSTPSDYISHIADKYNVPLYIRYGESDIRDDWNFAYNVADSEYVTIAHQDDVYHRDYVRYMLECLDRYADKNVVMYFSGYRPIKKGYISIDVNCIIRAILRFSMRFCHFASNKWMKKMILAFGNSICCPAVTYNKEYIGDDIFSSDLKFNIDWDTFVKLAKMDGVFAYKAKSLLFYRIHDKATSKEFIDNSNRFREDCIMFGKFWPKYLVKLIMKMYVLSYNTYR